MAQVREQLIDDHAALDTVLTQLQTALRAGDLRLAHNKLDLFWARLAVHIRAEHLHLFPTVSSRLQDEGQTVVAQLRKDHDFFMHELARAVDTMRGLLTVSEPSLVKVGLDNITNTILQVEQRLIKHNEIEESQVYDLASTLLNSQEQEKLAKQITTELKKRPPRFDSNTWANE